MLWARCKNVAAGAMLGGVAAAITFSVHGLTLATSNLLLRMLQTVAFAIAIPGLLIAVAARNVHPAGLGVAALCNFTFWFCFGWLCSYLVSTLRQKIRLLATHF